MTTILPLALITNSLIHINQVYNLVFALPIFLLLGILLGYGVSYYYTQYSYKDDDEYRKKTFINGYEIEGKAILPKFQIVNTIFVITHLLTAVSILVGLVLLVTSVFPVALYISIFLMIFGGYLYLLL